MSAENTPQAAVNNESKIGDNTDSNALEATSQQATAYDQSGHSTMSKPDSSKTENTERVSGSGAIVQNLFGGIVAIVAAFLASWVTFFIFQKQTEFQKKYEEIKLARELKSQYQADPSVYSNVQQAMESCQKLYYKNGDFDYTQINAFLTFFDDIGFYYKNGILTKEVITHNFGAILSAVLGNQEFKQYISETQSNTGQPKAYENIEILREIINQDSRFSGIPLKLANCKTTQSSK